MNNSPTQQEYVNPDIPASEVTAFVNRFIEDVWNGSNYWKMNEFLHEEYVDYSMPFRSFQNQSGLLLYLEQLGRQVYHRTEITNTTILDDLVICKIKISAIYSDEIANLNVTPEIILGYRIFKMVESKIIAHWEII